MSNTIGLEEVRRMCLEKERRISIGEDNGSGTKERKRDPCAL